MGASSSSRIGWFMKISRAFVQRCLISYSCSCTGLPGRLPRTVIEKSGKKRDDHQHRCLNKSKPQHSLGVKMRKRGHIFQPRQPFFPADPRQLMRNTAALLRLRLHAAGQPGPTLVLVLRRHPAWTAPCGVCMPLLYHAPDRRPNDTRHPPSNSRSMTESRSISVTVSAIARSGFSIVETLTEGARYECCWWKKQGPNVDPLRLR